MAREYLARCVANPLQAAAELARYRDAAQRLVRSPWAHHPIHLLADALLRQGTLSGEQIFELARHRGLSRRKPRIEGRASQASPVCPTIAPPEMPRTRASPRFRAFSQANTGTVCSRCRSYTSIGNPSQALFQECQAKGKMPFPEPRGGNATALQCRRRTSEGATSQDGGAQEPC